MFINPIANWCTTSFSNIEDTEEQIASSNSSTGLVFFIVMALLNFPLLTTLLHRNYDRPITYAQHVSTFTNYVYDIAYPILVVLICLINPAGILRTTYTIPIFLGLTLFVFFLLKHVPSIASESFLILFILALAILAENTISAFLQDTSTYLYFILYVLLYIIGYGMAMTTEAAMMKRVHYIKTEGAALLTTLSNIPGILIFEIIFILLFFYIRSLSSFYYGGESIVNDPISLSKTKTFTIPYNYHYAISCWMYMNATSPGHSQSSTEYTDVLLYGGLLMAYNSSQNKLRVIMKNSNSKIIYDVKHVPLQTWNHFVLSYSNGTFDLFMNGVLLKTGVIIPDSTSNELVIGCETGVSGELCNLLFFNTVISIEKINELYSQFKTKNPPII